jgi:protein-tyrosine-phosphatase
VSFNVLAVCTANICRSPMMEMSLRRLTAADGDVTVASAGSRGSDGRPADPVTATVASEFGLDLSSHQSQPLTAEVIDSADLIVVAEIDHLLAVIDKRPGAFAKTFLLLELASVAAPRLPTESLNEWVARHHEGRTPSAVMKSASAFALSDPYKQGDTKIRKAAQQVVDATTTIATSWR